MTLKEQLSEKLKEHEKTVSISEKIEEITELMKQNYLRGKFTISIYRLSYPYCISSVNPNKYIDTIPDGISDEAYLELYKKEIEKMGFSEKSYSFCSPTTSVGNYYEFTLRW